MWRLLLKRGVSPVGFNSFIRENFVSERDPVGVELTASSVSTSSGTGEGAVGPDIFNSAVPTTSIQAEIVVDAAPVILEPVADDGGGSDFLSFTAEPIETVQSVARRVGVETSFLVAGAAVLGLAVIMKFVRR